MHERILDDAPAYLLGELDAGARATVEAHLATCTQCRAEFAQLGEALASLANLAPEAEPPDRLRAAVMAAAEREGPALAIPLVTPSRARRQVDWGRWIPAVVAAAAAVAFAVQASAAAARVRTAEAAYHRVLAANGLLQGQLAAAQRGIALSLLQLEPTSSQTSAVASLAVASDADGGRVALVARGLQPLEGREVYQLWYLNGGAPVSAGVLQISGTTGHLQASLRPGARVDAAAISREPQPGDTEPKGPIILETA
jgi:anti-sigma-K factor RskA